MTKNIELSQLGTSKNLPLLLNQGLGLHMLGSRAHIFQ